MKKPSNASELFGKHLHDVYFGGNWTCSNLKEQLGDVKWEKANFTIQNLNSIATLAFHIHYYIEAILKVLEGGPLEAKDELSFDRPQIQSEEDWQSFLVKMWQDTERLSTLIQQLPGSQLWDRFTNEKYGDYARNILGMIEHTHYHLGQISLLKKLIHSD